MDERKVEKMISLSGLAVFFLGIALLVLIFFIAYALFTDPDKLGPFANLIPDSDVEYESALKAFGYLVAIGLLWVMGSIAARIAKHGIEMYKAQPLAALQMQQRNSIEAQPSTEPEKEIQALNLSEPLPNESQS